MGTLVTNRYAKFEYDILKKFEAGIVLSGQEVKSVRGGNISLKGAYATVAGNEVWLLNAHIGAYKKAGALTGYDPTSTRKLLLRRREINELIGVVKTQGLTLIPLALYTKGRRLKVEIGLARGRKQYEKREVIKKRDVDREIREKLKRS
ncbi:MAG: SsrA-binding protein SmpB [bacterium]|nr:SsrA-binding protein SmpB [bacterium]